MTKKTPKFAAFHSSTLTQDDVAAFEQAGFAPVIRWVRIRGRSDKALARYEVLDIIEKEKTKAAKGKP